MMCRHKANFYTYNVTDCVDRESGSEGAMQIWMMKKWHNVVQMTSSMHAVK